MIKGATKIAIVYIIVGVLWILVSDSLLSGANSDFWQNVKGISYVIVTGFILWLFLRRMEIRNEQYFQNLQCSLEQTREAKKKLLDERNLLRTVIDNLPDYIYVKNLKSEIVVVNKQTYKLVGDSDQHLSNEEINSRFKDYFLTCSNKEEQVLASGNAIIDEKVKIIRSNNEVRWLLNSVIPLFDSEQNLKGTVGLGRDITDSYNKSTMDDLMRQLVESLGRNKNLEVALSESLEIICKYFDFKVGEAWLLNAEKDKLDFTASYSETNSEICTQENHNSYNLDDGLLGETFRSAKMVIWTELDHEKIVGHLPEASQLSLHTCIGIPLIRDKQVLGVFILFTKNRFNEQQILEKVLEQISLQYIFYLEYKMHEIEIETVNAEIINLLETINDGYFSVNKNWTVNYWNAKTESLLDVPRAQVLGRSLWHLFPAEVIEIVGDHYHRAMNDAIAVRFEHYYDPITTWFEINIYPSKNGLSIFIRDITENKQLHQELKEQIDGLATSNAELEQFAYIASHDMQEPLRMITGFLGQVEKKYDSLLDEKGKQYIKFAVDGAMRMRKLILDLLEYSKVGKSDYHAEVFNVNELIDDVIKLNQVLIAENDIAFEIGTMPQIRGGKSLIHQLFQNLIMNAVKYRRSDRKTEVKIGGKSDKTYWIFWVSDNGIGINRDYFETIFVIFQRLHNKEQYSGTGIGLAICKKIVENHGGRIWVESEEGVGSTFYFTIKK